MNSIFFKAIFFSWMCFLFNSIGAMDTNVKAKKGYRYNVFCFGKYECPQFLKDAFLSIQSLNEQDLALSVSWTLDSGYYFLGAYCANGNDFFTASGKLKDLSDFICSCNRLDNDPSKLKNGFRSDLRTAGFTISSEEDSFVAYKKALASCYKIHLMPRVENFEDVLVALFNEFIENENFRSLIRNFKVNKKAAEFIQNYYEDDRRGLNFEISEIEDDVFLEQANIDFIKEHKGSGKRDLNLPSIVIYPALGKENAQIVLDRIIELFQCYDGLDIDLPFNKKITSLIYYSQGNSDDKIIKDLSQYFEHPKMIHYRSDFTGQAVDYRLNY